MYGEQRERIQQRKLSKWHHYKRSSWLARGAGDDGVSVSSAVSTDRAACQALVTNGFAKSIFNLMPAFC